MAHEILAPAFIVDNTFAGRTPMRVWCEAVIPTSHVCNTLRAQCVKTLQAHQMELRAFLRPFECPFWELFCSEHISAGVARVLSQVKGMGPLLSACVAYHLRSFHDTVRHITFVQNSLPRCRRHLQRWNDDVRHSSHNTSERVSCAAF